ncbi:MAG: class I SAM-dependent methyltransferase [Candidatus Woesearchaeota archaeon]|nr:class I SAM-dependent methyltransferase [Candidatus Woesearchaeota archaeon]MDP7323606.1 class I SAM-dependent methyltransferase [Candidatus Woesearchaeota archaeon]
MKEKESSQLTEELDCRIQTNQSFGDANLTSWLIPKLNLKKEDNLFDLGCGTGNHLLSFAKEIQTEFACTGADLSGKSLKEAEENSKKQQLKIKFLEQNMDNLDPELTSQKFDIITSIYAAYYTNDINALLKNLNNMLNQNGRIAIMGPYSNNNKGWFDFIYQFMDLSERVKKSTTTFMTDEILPFAINNFSTVNCYRFVNNIIIPTIEDLRNYWKSNIYYDEKLDPEFEKFAALHFSKNSNFTFQKVASLILMETKFEK